MNNIDSILKNIKLEAEQHLSDNDVTPSEAARDVAHWHDELYTPLRGQGRVDNLEVLMALRRHGALCADELETYRSQSCDFAEETFAAITQRSLEKFLHSALTTNSHETCYQ